MPLIKHRPEIAVLAPSLTLPGEALPLTVELTATRELPVKAVDVSLLGLDIYYLHAPGRDSSKSYPFEVMRAQQRVCDEGTLGVGTTRFGCRFELPEDVPPTFHGVNSIVQYLVIVQVVIPWWPDVRVEFEASVGWPPRPELEAEARAHSSAPGYFHGARLDVTLAQEMATTGGALDVAMMLEGLPPDQPLTGVRVSLVAQESGPLNLRDYVQSDVAYVFQCLEVPVEALADDRQVPLSVRVPRRIPPSYRSNRWALSWILRLESVVSWGQPVVFDVPLTLLPPLRAGNAGAHETVKLEAGRPSRAVPTVVTEGGQMVWQRVAGRAGFFFDGQTLHGRTGGAAITITSELRRHHAHLTCKLDFAPLNLDLRARPARGLEQLGGGLSIGIAPWDERFRVTGREALQITALLRGTEEHGSCLYELLLRPHGVEMDDDQIRLQWRGSGLDEGPLMEALEFANEVALELERARQHVPAPGAMAEMVPAWRALAEQLGGWLEPTHMAVRGTLHGHPLEVRTEWSSGEPLRTVVQLRAPAGPEPMHQLSLTVAAGQHEGRADLDALPEAARAPARDLLCGTRLLKLTPGAVRVDLDAPLADPAPARDRLGQMMRLLAALTSREGPYR